MPVKFALVGCGKIAERLALPQLKGLPGAEVAALVDVVRPAAERLADLFGIDRRRVWTDWKQMLREADVDAVAVNLPNVFHAEVTIACLETQRHVIVEKPMATTLADADAMVEAARRNGRYLMVEHTQRFEPLHEVAHEIVQGGLLGQVFHLRGRLGHAGPEHWAGTRATWLTDRRQAGGGALMDVGIHMVDLLRWLAGKQVKRICCHATTRQPRGSVEDNADALLEFTDGTLGAFEVSWATRPYELTTSFQGDRGRLHTAVGATPPVTVQFSALEGDPNRPLGEAFYPHVPAVSRTRGPYAHFTECITNQTPPCVSGEEGRAALEIVLAAYESLRSDGWVDLPLSESHRTDPAGQRSAREGASAAPRQTSRSGAGRARAR